MLEICDLFCGCGGSSTAILMAARQLGFDVSLTAINHWPVAIATHSANHPNARHLNESLDSVDPRILFPKRKLDLLWASPECTHFSIARGGIPRSAQSRASGWHILRWADVLRIDRIILENVPEWEDWGPLDNDGSPIKSKRGETFHAMIQGLRSIGYHVEFRVLTAANFGDPTSRRRLFVMANRMGEPIQWPEPEYSPTGAETLWGNTKKWKRAGDVIDWNLPAEPLFNRKKTLKEETLSRIETGMKLFNGEAFAVKYYGTGGYNSLDKPLDTITTRDRFGLAYKQNGQWYYRMLQPLELAQAMSFPSNYVFCGNRAEQVCQIGNAVPVRTAKALFQSMIAA